MDGATNCARFGLSGSSDFVVLDWNEMTMAAVTAALGCTNLGDNHCCAQSLWMDPVNNTCFTHNFAANFYNYPAPWFGGYQVAACNKP